MASDLDVLSKLDPLSWRGILLPYKSRRVAFQHQNAAHKFNFSGEVIEPTGAKSWTFEYGIPLKNALSSTARYGNLFGVVMGKLITAMRDKSPGKLYEPVYGRFFRCVPVELSDETLAEIRDGTDFTISFVYAPELSDLDTAAEFASRDNLKTEAGGMDVEVARVDWKQFVPPEPTVNPLQAIGGVADQIETGVNKNLNALERIVAQTEDMEDELADLGEPKNFALSRRSRRVRDLALRLRKSHGKPGRVIAQTETRYLQSVTELAVNLGMSLGDLLAINSDLVGASEVPKGRKVNYYRG